MMGSEEEDALNAGLREDESTETIFIKGILLCAY